MKKNVTNLYLSSSIVFTFTLILDVIVLLLRVVCSGVSNSWPLHADRFSFLAGCWVTVLASAVGDLETPWGICLLNWRTLFWQMSCESTASPSASDFTSDWRHPQRTWCKRPCDLISMHVLWYTFCISTAKDCKKHFERGVTVTGTFAVHGAESICQHTEFSFHSF